MTVQAPFSLYICTAMPAGGCDVLTRS
ncbi:hypothetical protein EMIT0194P_90099 [Pseudomonas serbica]